VRDSDERDTRAGVGTPDTQSTRHT
jgi:hypothetical protein